MPNAEPEILKRGKAFHREVQLNWSETAQGEIYCERTISLVPHQGVQRIRRGRIDLFVDGFGRMVVVVEIKGTDWDRVKNASALLSNHRRQIWKYIDNCVDSSGFDVCPGMIYPKAPRETGLKDKVESYLNKHGIQVVWYYE
jgi:hypothetical protein